MRKFVKIISALGPNVWYAHAVGQIVQVVDDKSIDSYKTNFIVWGMPLVIHKVDCCEMSVGRYLKKSRNQITKERRQRKRNRQFNS